MGWDSPEHRRSNRLCLCQGLAQRTLLRLRGDDHHNRNLGEVAMKNILVGLGALVLILLVLTLLAWIMTTTVGMTIGFVISVGVVLGVIGLVLYSLGEWVRSAFL